MIDAKTDPDSAALRLVRYMSSQGLRELEKALEREKHSRRMEARARARWHTVRAYRTGSVIHVLLNADSSRVRNFWKKGGVGGIVVSTVCGQSTYGHATDGEEEPTCTRCLRRWRRPPEAEKA